MEVPAGDLGGHRGRHSREAPGQIRWEVTGPHAGGWGRRPGAMEDAGDVDGEHATLPPAGPRRDMASNSTPSSSCRCRSSRTTSAWLAALPLMDVLAGREPLSPSGCEVAPGHVVMVGVA